MGTQIKKKNSGERTFLDLCIETMGCQMDYSMVGKHGLSLLITAFDDVSSSSATSG